jgi:hypothetical protein
MAAPSSTRASGTRSRAVRLEDRAVQNAAMSTSPKQILGPTLFAQSRARTGTKAPACDLVGRCQRN